MKKSTLFMTLTLFLCTAAFSRENPFDTTSAYEAEVARLMEVEEDYPYEFQSKEEQEEYKKKVTPHDLEVPKLNVSKEDMMRKEPAMQEKKPMMPQEQMKEVTLTKEEPKPTMQEKMAQPKQEMSAAKEESQKPIYEPEEKSVVDLTPTQKSIDLEKAMEHLKENKTIVVVPERNDIEPVVIPEINETVKILPFVTIHYTEDKIEISSKYNVFRKFTMDDRDKVVLDYHGKVHFGTKYHKFDTPYYKEVVLGNHVKERYFRIAVKLTHKPNKYKVTYKEGLVTILFDKDMI